MLSISERVEEGDGRDELVLVGEEGGKEGKRERGASGIQRAALLRTAAVQFE